MDSVAICLSAGVGLSIGVVIALVVHRRSVRDLAGRIVEPKYRK